MIQYIIDKYTWDRTDYKKVIKLENDYYVVMYDTESNFYQLFQKIEYFLFHPNNIINKTALKQQGCKTLQI